MQKFFYKLSRIVVICYVGLCAALYLFQDSLIYYPQPREVTDPQSTLQLPVKDAQLIVTVRAYTGPQAIIYFGGNAEDVSQNLAGFSRAFPEQALYLLHYRGYGGSSGSPSEEANHRDAAALLERVKAEHSDVTIIGRSLGTGVAVRLASQQPVTRLILVTPYNSAEDIAAATYPFVPVRWLLRDTYDSGKYAPTIHCPTTILAAENDTLIPRANTEKLLARFGPGIATMQIIPGTNHNDIGGSSQYLTALVKAF